MAVFVVWTAMGSASDASYMAVNLVLAWIPVVMSYGIAVAARTRVPLVALFLIGAAWLLFLPNAPYLLTDVVHVHNFSNPSPGLIAGGLGVLAVTGGRALLCLRRDGAEGRRPAPLRSRRTMSPLNERLDLSPRDVLRPLPALE